MPKTLNIGLIGAGRIGRVHAANLQRRIPDARVILVADPVEEAARAAADDFGIKFAVAEYQTVLQSPAVDAVVICSATHTHAAITMEAAAAGKHIFCEKPVAVDGTLTMLGVTRPLRLTVHSFGCTINPFNRRPICGADVEARLRRSEFGMTRSLTSIGDEVVIRSAVEAIPVAP